MAKKLAKGLLGQTGYTRLRLAYADFKFQLRFGGVRFHCPICGGRFRTLLPRGRDYPVLHELDVVPRMRNSTCPRCGSFDRERMLFIWLKERTDIWHRPLSVLHIAPESNLERLFLDAPNIRYTTADLLLPAMVRLDVTDIQFPDATFDVVLCSHVLEHVGDDRQAMSELHRVLRPGGWALLQVPIGRRLEETVEDPDASTDEERERRFGQSDHVRIYAKPDYVSRLTRAGFTVSCYDMLNELGARRSKRLGLEGCEELFLCERRP